MYCIKCFTCFTFNLYHNPMRKRNKITFYYTTPNYYAKLLFIHQELLKGIYQSLVPGS